MTVAQDTSPGLASRLVNGVLAIKPLFNVAKRQARSMMIKRAAAIGVDWHSEVQQLRARDSELDFDPAWEQELAQIQNPALIYPDYYLQPFHAYDQGNLSWEAATEVEVAAKAVHSRLWPETNAGSTMRLRHNYLDALNAQFTTAPRAILDMGCSVGISTFALQTAYPQAQITGVDLSPYFLAIAQYRAQQQAKQSFPAIQWKHAAAESTGLPDNSIDFVSAFLLCHELPQTATREILQEARRVLRPGGYFAMMDSNPKAEGYVKMPPYILTLLKSTEPYMDDYFAFDFEQAFVDAGFAPPIRSITSPRHHTLIAQVR
ncbi:class I SAM-dependent methyltransferase [filamentous cyanobacterium LEGE 11480]|uniref:Class I SAM-dependent methyltransferase n=1 Tax=Romeriopsis navalis LEGE 11480 TaxID=2777977 RepID=A0A928Z4S7_9CYAN|nr:class I SAM-dependent methyltransferase [Romeriopsis navalis]MBE9030515.1 class I SAM-dependent methyltransferase [Romeriopsis navalis LEGE 11480]